jgi:hypothetical protein
MNRAAPVVAVALTLAALSGFAQETKRPTVWIDTASQGASYLQAAVQRNRTPVTFITDKDSASQIATLQVEGKDGGTAKAVPIGPRFSGAERNMVLTVIDAKSYTVVFSYTCEKRGEGANFQSTAECLAKHWGEFLEKTKP